MFGLFKRNKIAQWEINLLKMILDMLPNEYKYLKEQLDSGLIRGILLGAGDIPNYVCFLLNPKIHNKFSDKKKKSFALKGIEVFDLKINQYTSFNLFVSSGTLNGYSTPQTKKFKPDINRIKISDLKKEYIDNVDFNKIVQLFEKSEMNLINPSDVYEVELNTKIYYHIKDLEDGDFIGIDKEKNIYKITHDPFEIVLLKTDLPTLLKEN